MKNITYLLGAGASAGAKGDSFPISGKILESLQNLREATRQRVMALRPEPSLRPPPEGTMGAQVMEAMDDLMRIAQNHPSLDTFARKLYLRNGPDDAAAIRQFKAALACYFLLLQTLQPRDQRYDHFFASILNPRSPGCPVFPPGINILSWNYDVQLEKAFRGFTTSAEHVFNTISSGPHVLRLNGACLYPDPALKEFFNLFFDDFNVSTLQHVENLYQKFAVVEPPVHFAWETDYFAEHVDKRLNEIGAETVVIVVIGYSFPFFNRDTDRLFFSQLLSLSHIEKVYIQVPKADHASTGERLKELMGRFTRKVEIRMIEGCDLFLLPSELDRAFGDANRET